MKESSTPSSKPLDATENFGRFSRVDEICKSFADAWQGGQRPRIEDYLGNLPEAAREGLLEELLREEAYLRRAAGESVTAEEYLSRFPHHRETVARALGTAKAAGGSTYSFACADADSIGLRGEGATPPDALPETMAGKERTSSTPAGHPPDFGDYEILGEIARGGMGVVYRARQKRLNRTVALKMILAGQLASEAEIKRFYTEAEAAAQLDHSGIVPIYEVGQQGSQHFFSMAYIEGHSLQDRVKSGPLPPREAAELLAQVADAVQFAHSKGIVHRDLKPHNILLDVDGKPKVTDFGLAKRIDSVDGLTNTGDVLGTPNYMAPEQAEGKAHELGPLVDVHALGAMLYATLTGRPPFQAASLAELLRQVIQQEVVAPKLLNGAVPKDLDTICMKCLQKDPQRRYSSARELHADLRRFLQGEPIAARPVSQIERYMRWCRRNPGLASLLSSTAVLLVGIAVVSAAAYFQTRHSLGVAQTANKRAQDALAAEEKQRRLTETTLADMYTSHGLAAAKRGEFQEALLWFATAANAAQFDPDREYANRLRFRNWSRHLPMPVRAVRLEEGTVENLDFHSTNKHVLLHTTTGAVIWDLQQDSLSPLPSCRAVWSYDGTLLAVGKSDGRVEVSSFPQAQPLHSFQLAEAATPQLGFSHDNQFLAAGVSTLRTYNLGRKELMPGEALHPDQILSIEFSHDTACVVTSCADAMGRVFRITDDRLDSKTQLAPISHRNKNGGVGIKFFPPLISIDDQVVFSQHVVDLRHGEVARTLHVDTGFVANGVRSTDGPLVSLSYEGDHGDVRGETCGVLTFDVRSGNQVSRIKYQERIPGLAISADGNRLITSSFDSTLRVWNSYTGTAVGAPFRHQGPVDTIALSRDGTYCATAQADRTVRIFRLPVDSLTADAAIPLNERYQAHEPTIDAAGRWVVTPGGHWGNPREFSVYDTVRGFPQTAPVRVNADLIATTMSDDGVYVATFSAAPGSPSIHANVNTSGYVNRPGEIAVWNWHNGQHSTPPVVTSSLPLDGAFSPDRKTLAAVCANGEVLLVDLRTSSVERRLNHVGQTSPGYALPRRMIRFATRGHRFVTLGFGQAARIWTREGALIAELNHKGILSEANFSSDGKFLVTASWDGTAQVWDGTTGERVGRILHHPTYVLSATFSADSNLVATSCDDRMARIWNWRKGQLIGPGLEHSGQVWSTWRHHETGLVVTAGNTGNAGEAQFWETITGKSIAPARALSNSEQRLLITKDGKRAVVTGTAMNAIIDVFGLSELALLGEADLRGDSLKTLAELASGRRVEKGGALRLTSDEWFERWKAARQADRGIQRLELDRRQEIRWRYEQLRTNQREDNWDGALFNLEFILRASPTDTFALAVRAQALAALGRLKESAQAVAEAREGIVKLDPAEAYYPRSILDGLSWLEQFANGPAPAIAPFGADRAKKHQEEWANHLGVPVEYENSIGMKFVLIPPGEFTMGAPENADPVHHGDEKPAHRVLITRPYYMGKFEVTVGEFRMFVAATDYKTVAESNGKGARGFNVQTGKLEQKPEYTWRNPGFQQSDEHPIVSISWNDAVAFSAWLDRTQNRRHALPTEAQWEMACRAGTTSAFYFGDARELHANFENIADASLAKLPGAPRYCESWDDGYAYTAPVGQFLPNAYGLHDLLGNVLELCADRYDANYYRISPRENPSGPVDAVNATRAYRGSSYWGWAGPSHNRWHAPEDDSEFNKGMRVVVEIDGPEAKATAYGTH